MTFKTNISLAILPLLVVACVAPLEEHPEDSGIFAGLPAALEQVRTDNQLMGMSVLLMAGGDVRYADGFGLADSLRQLPATANTIYRLASISKSVTATALMILYDEGRIDLDADISQYLDFSLRHPRFPDVPITLRMLLSHTSGLKDGKGYFAFSQAMSKEPLHLRDLFVPGGRFFTEDLFHDHAPGAFFTYANCPWGIIASVIEGSSGQRFDIFCRERIFQPLEMNASFNVRDLRDIDSLAVLYRYEENQWVPQADDYRGIRPEKRAAPGYVPGTNGLLYGPQGSLRASVSALSRFMLLHYHEGEYAGRRILQPATARMMREAQWTFDGSNGNTYGNFYFSWGLGFHRITRRDSMDIIFPDRDMVGHPGEAYGLISDMYFDPDTGSGVIFATNGSKVDFPYGKRTTFYKPEEDVFSTVYPFLKAWENEQQNAD